MNAAMLIDAEFLRQDAQAALGIERSNYNVPVLADWIRGSDIEHIRWYDGRYKPSDARYQAHKYWLDCLARDAGVKLRLGTLVERDSSLYERAMYRILPQVAADLNIDDGALKRAMQAHWESRSYFQQKGVDALLILDMVQLAMSGNIGALCLCAGDTDFIPAIDAVQQCGVPVNLVVPRPNKLSRQMTSAADQAIAIPMDILRRSFSDSQRADWGTGNVPAR